jgi:ribonuclease BN (tRNA processing enzyme)
MKDEKSLTDTITFLGTGGGRGMITSQTLASGGLWLNLGGTQILVDPGPGCIVRATDKKLNAENLSAIILSHLHLDHSADMNIMVEAMTKSGHNQHGVLFLPPDALAPEPVVFSYLRNYVDRVVVLEEGGEYSVDGISFTTPVRHIHKPITYGIVFKTPRHTFSYITDTRFFDDLCRHYGGELLIINTLFLEPRPESTDPLLPTDHLGITDAEKIIRELKPKTAIITHFGMGLWQARPQKIAGSLTEKLGIKVIAARDGMEFDLGELDIDK